MSSTFTSTATPILCAHSQIKTLCPARGAGHVCQLFTTALSSVNKTRLSRVQSFKTNRKGGGLESLDTCEYILVQHFGGLSHHLHEKKWARLIHFASFSLRQNRSLNVKRYTVHSIPSFPPTLFESWTMYRTMRYSMLISNWVVIWCNWMHR
jgi:hypothetical protein